MNAKIIDGLKEIRKGIDTLLEAIDNAEEVKCTSSEVSESVSVSSAEKSAEVAKTQESEDMPVTREDLEAMSYNSIKKFASSAGLSAKGNREELIARILGEEKVEEEPVEVPEEVEEAPVDPLYDKVVAAVEDMENEDIADILAEVGISAKGKRETLIDKLVKAVREGLVDFDEEDEEVDDEEDGIEEAPVSADSEDDEDDEEDNINDIENPEMTNERRKALLAEDTKIRKKYSAGKLSRKEMEKFLYEFYEEESGLEDMSDSDVLDTYIDAVCRLIDDEGDLTDSGAYMLNDTPACCGRFLKYSEDTQMFICEHCGTEYEADDED